MTPYLLQANRQKYSNFNTNLKSVEFYPPVKPVIPLTPKIPHAINIVRPKTVVVAADVLEVTAPFGYCADGTVCASAAAAQTDYNNQIALQEQQNTSTDSGDGSGSTATTTAPATTATVTASTTDVVGHYNNILFLIGGLTAAFATLITLKVVKL